MLADGGAASGGKSKKQEPDNAGANGNFESAKLMSKIVTAVPVTFPRHRSQTPRNMIDVGCNRHHDRRSPAWTFVRMIRHEAESIHKASAAHYRASPSSLKTKQH